MVATIILPPAAALEAAARELRSQAEGNAKRLIALNKAEYDLLVLHPQIVRVSGAYLVPSTSRAGIIHYIDDLAGCDCEAGRAGRTCRHAIALELIEQANTHTMPALPRRASDAEYAQACADMSELFA